MNLNMEQVEMLIEQIAVNTMKDKKHYDVVVGISRGGLVPMVYLSHYLGIDKVLVVYGRETIDDRINAEKREPVIQYDERRIATIKGKKVLLVDDIVGSGKMLKKVKSILSSFTPETVDTAVLVLNEDNLEKAGYKLEEYQNEIEYLGLCTRGWVVFPWENGGAEI